MKIEAKHGDQVVTGELPQPSDEPVVGLVPMQFEFSFGKGLYSNNVKVVVPVTRWVRPPHLRGASVDDADEVEATRAAMAAFKSSVRAVLPDLRKMLAGAMADLQNPWQWDPLGDGAQEPQAAVKPLPPTNTHALPGGGFLPPP